MPPINQGSRGGLITAVVIFTILFVTATIFAIIYSVEARRLSEELDTTRQRYSEVGEVDGNSVQELLAQRANSPYAGVTEGMSAIDVAVQQRDALARRIAGAGASATTVLNTADTAFSSATTTLKDAGVTIPTDSFTNAITTLAAAVEKNFQNNQQLQQQLQQQTDRAEAAIKRTGEAVAAKDQEVTGTSTQLSAALSNINQQLAGKDQQITDMQAQFAQDIQRTNETLQQSQVTVAEKDAEIKNLQTQINALQNRLGQQRLDPSGSVVRQADGRILRLPGNDIAYINLGQGDQIAPGLTFQVYDKAEGIPTASVTGEESETDVLPQGKAEIEVIRVGPGSSECRIIKIYPGRTLAEGDYIANLIYDRNTKYNFLVYGQFDLDHNGQATDGDAEVVKRLITQWGGGLTDQINVNTDFVVLGQEPALPQFTADELQDPFNVKRLNDAQAALDAYLAVREQARSLYIPILNQNRFLYYVGYYSQATR